MSSYASKNRPRFSRAVLLSSTVCAWTATLTLQADAAKPAAAATSVKSTSAVSKSPQPVKTGKNAIDRAVLSESEDGTTTLRITGRKAPTFNVYRLSSPERLIIDLSESQRGSVHEELRAATWAVDHVRFLETQQAGANLVRVSVELERDVSYVVVPNGNDLVVTITPNEAPPESRQARVRALAEQAKLRQEQGQAQANLAATKAKVAQLSQANSQAAQQEAARLVALRADAQAQEERARLAQGRAKEADLAAQAAEARALAATQTREQAEREAKVLLDQAQAMLAAAQREQSTATQHHEAAKQAVVAAKVAQGKATTAQEKRDRKQAWNSAQQAELKSRAEQERLANLVAQLERDRKRLVLALESQADQRDALEHSLASKEVQVATLKQEIAAAQAKAQQGVASTRDAARAQQALAQLENTHFALEQEVSRLRDAQKQAQERAKLAEARLAVAQKRVNDQREVQDATNAVKRERAELEKVAQALQVRDRELTAVQNKVEAGRAEVATLQANKQKLTQSNRELEQARKALQSTITRDQSELSRMQAASAQEAQRLDALQAKVARAQSQLDKTLLALEQGVQRRDQQAPTAVPPASAMANAAAPSRVVPATPASAPAGGPVHAVSALAFRDEPDAAKIELDVPAAAVVEQRRLTPSMQMLVIGHARLPKDLERTLDATSYRGPIGKITSYNENDEVRVMVAAAADSAAYMERQGNRLLWVFPKGVASNQLGNAQRLHETTVAPASTENPSSAPAANAPATGTGPRSKWRGERIDIELQEAPIKDVLLLFSDIGRVNIIAGKDVEGVVTMKLNAVPWDQALDMILRSLALGMVQEGNVIRVATQADLEQERVKAIERANAQVQLKPMETRLIPLSYATVAEMLPKVQSVLSPRGTVTPDTRTNMLIVMDVAENIALSEQLIAQLDSQTPQVLIEARIVEARVSWLRQLGIQWGVDMIASPGTGNPTGLFFPNSVGVAGGAAPANADARGLILPAAAASPNYAVNLPAPVGNGAGGAIGFSFGSIAGNVNTNLRLSAAEEEGEVRLISAPKVVTMDNTEAKIEQGVQIPISQVSQNGVNTRYVSATLGLEVVPHVTNEGSVILEVKVQKNEADFVNTGARGDPTILTKQAESKMLILDGDTAVIGGIYTRNQSKNNKKVPWLADIPIIGWFFKNRAEADTRTELLIFLTPKIVNRSTSIGG